MQHYNLNAAIYRNMQAKTVVVLLLIACLVMQSESFWRRRRRRRYVARRRRYVARRRSPPTTTAPTFVGYYGDNEQEVEDNTDDIDDVSKYKYCCEY